MGGGGGDGAGFYTIFTLSESTDGVSLTSVMLYETDTFRQRRPDGQLSENSGSEYEAAQLLMESHFGS